MPSPQRQPLRTSTLRPTRVLLAPVVSAILAMGHAQAADTLDTACKTTAECQAQVAKIQGTVKGDATSALSKSQDTFYWFGRINMASTVVNVEQGIIPKAQAGRIARGVELSRGSRIGRWLDAEGPTPANQAAKANQPDFGIASGRPECPCVTRVTMATSSEPKKPM